MRETVSIPVAILNRTILPPDSLLLYAWIAYSSGTGEKKRVSFQEVTVMTGLSQQKISQGLNLLERLQLVELERQSGKVFARSEKDIPEVFTRMFDSGREEIERRKKLDEINKEIKTSTL